MANEAGAVPATNGTTPEQPQGDQAIAIVSRRRADARARRTRSWARQHLDALVDPPVVPSTAAVDCDYWAEVGMTMGWPERRDAGLALLERERAA